jgi:excisionase family DNA binding protein
MNASELDGLPIPQRLARLKCGITAAALADLLGVSGVTIYKVAAKYVLPSYRVGTSLRFDPYAVAHWLQGGDQ